MNNELLALISAIVKVMKPSAKSFARGSSVERGADCCVPHEQVVASSRAYANLGFSLSGIEELVQGLPGEMKH